MVAGRRNDARTMATKKPESRIRRGFLLVLALLVTGGGAPHRTTAGDGIRLRMLRYARPRSAAPPVSHTPDVRTMMARLFTYTDVWIIEIDTSVMKVGIRAGMDAEGRWKGMFVDSLFRVSGPDSPVCAVNGSFFGSDRSPIGLVVSRGRVLSALRRIPFSGVFYLYRSGYRIVSYPNYVRYFGPSSGRIIPREALQSFPLLAAGGCPYRRGAARRASSMYARRAPRTAIGVSRNGTTVYIVITEDNNLNGLTLDELTEITLSNTRASELLNLDGGTSSQLVLRNRRYELSIMGSKPVPTFVVVERKTKTQ